MPLKMDHNEFNLDHDLIEPIKLFFKKLAKKRMLERRMKQSNKSEGEEAKSAEKKEEKAEQRTDIENPYIDEFDKKKKKARKAEVKSKNFEPGISDPRK